MNWDSFQAYGESNNKAFEAMCNQLFEHWCKRELKDLDYSFYVVNGAGGDGGVEAYVRRTDLSEWGVQAKWFPNTIKNSEISQIRKSIKAAIKVHPKLEKYIVCVPRALTAEKVTKNGIVTNNTEWNRWETFLEEMKTAFPCLEITLWDESRLLEQLQQADCAGIETYWFKHAQITDDVLRHSIDAQRYSWLKPKYVPALHRNGFIKIWLDEMLGFSHCREELIAKINEHINVCKSLQKSISILERNSNGWGLSEETVSQILLIGTDVSAFFDVLKYIEECLTLDLPVEESRYAVKVDWTRLHITIDGLKKISHRQDGYFNRKQLKNDLEHLYALDLDLLLSNVENCLNYKKIVIKGNQGTGKTHALADYVFKNDGPVIPILVRAKDVPQSYTWKDIIIQSLGLSNDWSENDIWNALEAMAWRKDSGVLSSEITVKNKVLICVDGVDEKRPFERWIERIRESDVISGKFPRIYFCFSGRPCAFKDGFDDRYLSIPYAGDVPVHAIYEDYLSYYKIDATECPVLKWSLQTPFSLGLFCQANQGEKLDLECIKRSTTVVTKLIAQHLDKIESEYAKRTNDDLKNGSVKRVLNSLTTLFLETYEPNRADLIYDTLAKNPGVLTRKQIEDVLLILEEYGVVSCYTSEPNSILDVPETHYTIGIQPFFDFLLARIAVDKNKYNKDGLLLTDIGLNATATQMLSLIILEETGQLEGERYYNEKKRVADDDTLEYACFALRNASPEFIEDHVNYISEIMLLHSDYFHRIVNNVILPVCRRGEHPLGSKLFHEICMRFSTPIERDMLWSTPGYLHRAYETACWNSCYSIQIVSEQYELTKEDDAWGLPIVYAWMLTALDQRLRAYARRSLAYWGTIRPDEFCRLFEATMETNDPQMRTDLAAIAMAVGCNPKTPVDNVRHLAKWFLKNVFVQSACERFHSSTLRHYGRCIVECAYVRKCVSVSGVTKCRPPYRRRKKLLNLDIDQLNGIRRYSDTPFDYDLSRYVLNDPLTYAFFGNGNWNDSYNDAHPLEDYYSYDELKAILQSGTVLSRISKHKANVALDAWRRRNLFVSAFYGLHQEDESDAEIISISEKESRNKEPSPAEALLKKHAKKYGISNISAHDFFHAAAMSFFVDMGWDCEYRNTTAAEFDSAVRGTYYKATHGSQSVVMSIGEKYTWEAKYMLISYLADSVPSTSYGTSGEYISDYVTTENYPNPLQEHVYAAKQEELNVFLPQISKTAYEGVPSANDLRHYLRTNDSPINPIDWVTATVETGKASFSLYRYYSTNADQGIANVIWLSAVMVSKKDLPLFRKDISNKRSKLVEFLGEPGSIEAAPMCACYSTPLELCWMKWRADDCSHESQISLYNKQFVPYSIIKAVTSCVAGFVDEGAARNAQFNVKEEHFYLPAQIIRNEMGISFYDGTHFWDENDVSVGFYTEVGEGWDLNQRLLAVDPERLKKVLKENDLALVWSVRLLQEADIKTRERLSMYDRRDRCWIVEKCERGYKTYPLYDKYEN